MPAGAGFCPGCGARAAAGPALPGYTVLRTLGEGGSATVFLARQEALDRLVALKVLRRDVDDPAAWRRFQREARTIARLSGHPNVVTIYTTGRSEAGHPFLVTEYLDRGSLADVTADDGPLPPTVVATIGVAVADALIAGHGQGILHRDVKPGNVLLGRDGRVKLGDFGIARLLAGHSVTTTDVVAFTPEHVAPEVLRGERDGPESDVYGLGSTLATALAGTPPFVRGPEERMDAFLARKMIARPPSLAPGVPPELAAAVLAALDPDPSARPDLAELRSRLQRVADGSPATLPPPAAAMLPVTAVLPVTDEPHPPEPLVGPVRRPRWAAISAAAAVLAVLAAGVIAVAALSGRDPGDGEAVPTTGAPVSAVVPGGVGTAAATSPPTTMLAPTTTTAAAATTVVATSPPATSPPTATPTTAAPAAAPVATAPPETSPPPTAADTTPPTEPPEPPALAAEPEAERFVRNYYDLVAAEDYDRSWAHLSPEFQQGMAVSYDYYVDFWEDNDIDVGDVEVVELRPDAAVLHVELRWNGDRQPVVDEITLRRGPDGELLIAEQENVG